VLPLPLPAALRAAATAAAPLDPVPSMRMALHVAPGRRRRRRRWRRAEAERPLPASQSTPLLPNGHTNHAQLASSARKISELSPWCGEGSFFPCRRWHSEQDGNCDESRPS
jgi:hypothetical protein